MPAPRTRASVPPVDPAAYQPTAQRPVRAKLRHLTADTQVQPHSHPWVQVVFSSSGVIRMTAGRSTYLVPPSRAVWIPPQMEHSVNVVEDADLRTLYLHPQPGGCDMPRALDSATGGPPTHLLAGSSSGGCRVLEVSKLLRELVPELPIALEPGEPTAREALVSALILDELARARPVRLGVDLPADPRLRSLCEAVLADPARWLTLAQCASAAGASARTVARLFRSELGTTFVQWRQQVLLARALTLAAKGRSMNLIAAELGYASASAFTAMVTRSVGMPPSRFFAATPAGLATIHSL
jgi:AraC-like DNA-binding protein